MADNKSSGDKKIISAGSLIITADVSDAIKGLKVVQREAKKATAALKDLEEYQKRVMFQSDVEGLKPPTVVFDEMHSMCLRCGSTNREQEVLTKSDKVYAARIRCTDCGLSYA